MLLLKILTKKDMYNFIRSFRYISKKAKLYGFKQSVLYIGKASKIILYNQLIKNSFSQNNEDLVIDKLLNYKKNGFYIDLGAYDPKWFSNTNRFYKKGWRGINIEPNITRYQKFLKYRPNDINLNLGIGSTNGLLKFYLFQPNTISTFSQKEAKYYQKLDFQLEKTILIEVRRLDYLIKKYIKKNKIDFLTIDIEGKELDALKSNDWNKFRPKVICIESFSLETKLGNSKEHLPLKRFLVSKGYQEVYRNPINIIYIDKVSF